MLTTRVLSASATTSAAASAAQAAKPAPSTATTTATSLPTSTVAKSATVAYLSAGVERHRPCPTTGPVCRWILFLLVVLVVLLVILIVLVLIILATGNESGATVFASSPPAPSFFNPATVPDPVPSQSVSSAATAITVATDRAAAIPSTSGSGPFPVFQLNDHRHHHGGGTGGMIQADNNIQ